MEFQLLRACQVETQDEAAVVCFLADKVSLNESTTIRFADHLSTITKKLEQPRLILDFGNVEYISRLAIGTLLDLNKCLMTNGKCLTIDNLCPNVYEAFAIRRLDRFLHLEPAEPQPQSPFERKHVRRRGGVLVADGDPNILSSLEIMISRAGYRSWLAVHGYHAIEQYRHHWREMAAVLLDVQMPGLNGPDALQVMRKCCPIVRCCFMTDNARQLAVETLLKLGAICVFSKPLSPSVVIDTLRELLSKSC
jgi:anti-anti-sigma factor